ncbi:MAG: histidine kinase [Flexilinea sp.]
MTALKQQYQRLRLKLNNIQWQITLIITSCSVIVCVVVLVFRYVRASYMLSERNSSTLIANAVTQILSDPWVKDEFVPGVEHGKTGEKTNYGMPPRRLDVQLGSFEDEIRVDINYLLKNRVFIYYITEMKEIFPVAIGGSVPISLEDLDKETAALIKNNAMSMLDQSTGRSPYGQVIVTENNYSMALVPFVDNSNKIVGSFFLYVTQPSSWEMMRAVFLSSVTSFIKMIIFAAILGLIVGNIFSRKWVHWFDAISKASYQWAEGDFSRKIPIKEEQDYSELRMVSEKLNNMADQLEQVVQTRQELAASEERNRISRELHDNIKQQVFSINMNLGAAAVLIDKKPEQVREKIELASSLTGDTLQDLDALIGTLRPPLISGEKLIKKLEEYGHNWQKISGIKLDLVLQNTPPMDENTAGEVYRICQEALSNIMRHSKADHGSILLETNEIEINLSIRDNGQGFDMNEQQTGIGLRSIRERVEKLSGTFNIQSGKDGTSLFIYIPRKMQF